MDKKRIEEIKGMFPEQKPVVYNYTSGRAIVMELLEAVQRRKAIRFRRVLKP